MKISSPFFFLGGRALEMGTIRELREAHAPGRFVDKGLAWGAKASDYGPEIAEAGKRGDVPVLIELALDMELPGNAVIIDHHGERAGADMPTALEQVFDFLGLDRQRQWTRHFELVAANDRGHIAGMQEAGASRREIAAIRRAEWRALGLDEKDEREVRQALAGLEKQGRCKGYR